jgi:hypothetical protein
MIGVPGYWMHETSGVLRPAIEAYLHNRPMTAEQIAAMRSYLCQWIAADAWMGPEVGELRAGIDGLVSQTAIRQWLGKAEEAGIDPL